jgi:NADPH-dependent 2,4-dienoyl-CoA reductase/sulfur reductase-like enzyme
MRNIVIAGASAAGLNAATQLRRSGFGGSITLLDRELGRPYRRPEVSKGILGGQLVRDAIAVPWPEDMDLKLIDGVTIDSADLTGRTITVLHNETSETLQFDGLVIATGSVARPSPFPALRGVHTLRTVADAERMSMELAEAQRVVIMGGGFIGLEVAAVCRALGKPVTVIEATGMPLGRVLGDEFSGHLVRMHLERGVEIATNLSVTGLQAGPTGSVASVHLSDGRELAADLVLIAIGSMPAADWLQGSGLDVRSGVLCDTTCAVEGTENVVAAGDAANWVNPLYRMRMRVEHWTNAVEQGMYAARRLLGVHDPAGYVSAPYFWSDQYGMRIQSVGTTIGHDQAVVFESSGDRMLVGYAKDGILRAVAGVHAGASVTRMKRLVTDGVDIETARTKAGEFAARRSPTATGSLGIPA